MPETLIPLIAILFASGNNFRDIGVGAILGAPFMLSTLAMFVSGAALVIFKVKKGRQLNLRVNRAVTTRDLVFFLTFYMAAIMAGVVHLKALDVTLAPLLWIGYLIYAYMTFMTEGDLDEETRALYFHRSHLPELPRLRRIVPQIAVSLAAIVLGARLFVGAVSTIAGLIGLPALVISLLLSPVATELPEKINSVLWIRSGKDTLALGNITGAMVFQSVFPVSVGLLLTGWRLDSVSVLSATLALFSAFVLLFWLRIKGAIAWWMLLLGGIWYAAFVSYAIATNV